MSKPIKIAKTSDVSPGTGKVIETEGRCIALFNVAGNFHAIDNTCTHEAVFRFSRIWKIAPFGLA